MKYIRGTYHLSKIGVETDDIRSLIQRRRLQVLIHSCIYYRLGRSLVTDQQWDRWARELVELQRSYPYISSRVDYHKYFKSFDASTGFDLPIDNEEIINKANLLVALDMTERKTNGSDRSNGTARTIKVRFDQLPRDRGKNKRERRM